MQRKWLQLFCLCAAIQFQPIVGFPNAGIAKEDQPAHLQAEAETTISPNNDDVQSLQATHDSTHMNQPTYESSTPQLQNAGDSNRDGKQYWPQENRHICTRFTENYDCQFQNVHLKNNELHMFGHRQNSKNDQQYITFRDSTLDYLPKSLIDTFPKLNLLNLNELRISSIERNAFDSAANLRTLFLEDNRLTNINQDAFRGARKLQTLVLTKNEISAIDYTSFDYNAVLQILHLDQNQLETLPAFEHTQQLQYLNASHNNLASIDDQHFVHLNKLAKLDLSFNRLERLNLPNSYSSLDQVDVSSNHLTEFLIPPTVTRLKATNNSLTRFDVSQLCRLQHLTLSRNKLETVPDLRSCRSLETLDLTYNLLESFKLTETMTSLQMLRLAHNHLFNFIQPLKPPKVQGFSLRILDLSNNKLSQGPSLQVFNQLEQVRLNDNNLITLKSYHDATMKKFKGYHMLNNEWSCDDVHKFENLTLDKGGDYCSKEMTKQNNICCRKYNTPYNDRLNEVLRDADLHERLNRKKCPKPVSNNRNDHTKSDEIRDALVSANAATSAILNEINNVRKQDSLQRQQLEILKAKRERLNDSQRSVALEIEKQRRYYRVPMEGLISDREMLERIIQFVKEKDTFNKGLLSRRSLDTEESNRLLDEKRKETKELQETIVNLKATITALRKEEKDNKIEKDRLEKQARKNAPSIHGGTGRTN